MAAITWRNVTGASAGNPGSSLATAISGFGMAGRGALDQIDSLRKGEAIKNAELTQRAIANTMAAGKPLDAQALNNFAPGVDTSEVLKSVLGARRDQADIAFSKERTETEAFNNDPLTIERNRQAEDRKNALLENELNLRQERLAFDIGKNKRENKVFTDADSIDAGWDEYYAKGIAPREQATNDTVAQIQASNFSDEEKIIMIDAARRDLNLYQEEWKQNNIGGYMSEARKTGGMSRRALNESRAGQFDKELRTRAQDRSDARNEADLEYRNRQDTVWKSAMGGVNLNQISYDADGGLIALTEKGDISKNKMSQNELYEQVRGGADGSTNFLWKKDAEIPPEAKTRLDALYSTLDGNRGALQQLLKNADVKYDPEHFATDEVHNLPTVEDALDLKRQMMAGSKLEYEANARVGRPGAEGRSGGSLEAILAQLQQRRSQDTAQALGSGVFDQNPGAQLQDYLNRASAPRLGPVDPRLTR